MVDLDNIEHDVVVDGGSNKVDIISEIEDSEGMKHSFLWTFTADIGSDYKNPRLDVIKFAHKRFERECDPGALSEEDGSELLESFGFLSPEREITVFRGVKDVLEGLFTQDIVDNTFDKSNIKIGLDLPAELYDFELRIDGSYSEKNDDGEFDNWVYSWWLGPVDGNKFRIEKCVVKEYEKGASRSLSDDMPGEEIVDCRKTQEKSPEMDSLPEEIILQSLVTWWGYDMTENSVGEIPVVLYRCLGCDRGLKTHPVDTCPKCGSDSLIHFKGTEEEFKEMEDYPNTVTDVVNS